MKRNCIKCESVQKFKGVKEGGYVCEGCKGIYYPCTGCETRVSETKGALCSVCKKEKNKKNSPLHSLVGITTLAVVGVAILKKPSMAAQLGKVVKDIKL